MDSEGMERFSVPSSVYRGESLSVPFRPMTPIDAYRMDDLYSLHVLHQDLKNHFNDTFYCYVNKINSAARTRFGTSHGEAYEALRLAIKDASLRAIAVLSTFHQATPGSVSVTGMTCGSHTLISCELPWYLKEDEVLELVLGQEYERVTELKYPPHIVYKYDQTKSSNHHFFIVHEGGVETFRNFHKNLLGYEVFDILFKWFRTKDIPYPESLEGFFHFMEYYFFLVPFTTEPKYPQRESTRIFHCIDTIGKYMIKKLNL